MTREEQLLNWVTQLFVNRQYHLAGPLQLEVVSGDASFRRYFRVKVPAQVNAAEQTYIAVDAPPDKEDNHPFVAIARGLVNHGVHAPQVLASDLDQGFMLLSDMGDQLLWPALTPDTADAYYQEAMLELLNIQTCTQVDGYDIPAYDADRLNEEMLLFPQWCLDKKLNLALSQQEQTLLASTMQTLVDSALAQPQVFVHRDYHSRNIMLCQPTSGKESSLGIIDFQDGVIGPVTYDLVSILKDCYIAWPRRQVMLWVKDFYVMMTLHNETMMQNITFDQFLKWFDFMGLQRHLKVLGIFCRLSIRDGKDGYLNDMPLTAKYVWDTLKLYPELAEFKAWFETRVLPSMAEQPEFDMTDVMPA